MNSPGRGSLTPHILAVGGTALPLTTLSLLEEKSAFLSLSSTDSLSPVQNYTERVGSPVGPALERGEVAFRCPLNWS